MEKCVTILQAVISSRGYSRKHY